MSSEEWRPLVKKYNPLQVGSIDGTDTEPHDRAVVRAMNARYKPNKSVHGNPENTIFVGRLNEDTTEDSLKEAFEYFGEITNIRLVRDIVTGFSKRYAFIEYSSEQDASRAYRDGHKMVIDQHEVLVDYEHARSLPGWVPRRLGGGFCGKKEAGQLRFGCRDRPFSKPILLGKGGPQGTSQGYRTGRDRRMRDSSPTHYSSPNRPYRHRDDRREKYR